jgi:hypothetical protein
MARYVHEFSKKLTWMVGSNIQKGPKGEEATQVDGDITYKGSDFTASAKASYGISPQGVRPYPLFPWSRINTCMTKTGELDNPLAI